MKTKWFSFLLVNLAVLLARKVMHSTAGKIQPVKGNKMVHRELVRFYFDTVSLNEHLQQWYRAIFVAFHGGVVLAVLFANRRDGFEESIPYLVGFGLFVSFLWVWITCHRANIVERQKEKIREILNKHDDKALLDWFKIYDYKRLRCFVEFTFNFGLPLAVGFLLIFAPWILGTISWLCRALIAVIFVISLTYAKKTLSRYWVPKD